MKGSRHRHGEHEEWYLKKGRNNPFLRIFLEKYFSIDSWKLFGGKVIMETDENDDSLSQMQS